MKHNAVRSSRILRAAAAAAALASTGLVGLTGCASMNQKERGATIGAATGAVAGAVIGNQTGSTVRGAIIGAAVGGAAGAIIGHQMDQQAKEIQNDVPGATVARVGEGIAVTFASGLLFDFDSDVLREQAKANLRTLANSLSEKYPNTDLVIVGHTDSQGGDSYNLALSERRARAAANYLISQGVAPSRLKTYGRGESEPIASNTTVEGQQQNRRVEVAIFANEAARAEARRQAGSQ